MEASPDNLDHQTIYKLMTGSIVPRPIGWVSTIDVNGQPNLAPFSFFTMVCPKPPHVLFCPSVRSTDMGKKDTLNNVRATGQFVLNIVTEPLAEAMNLSATELPPDVDEFEFSGLKTAPSALVKPYRVAESPVHFECEVTQIIDIGDLPGAGSIVIGQVVHIHVDESVLMGNDKIDLAALQPIGRLAGTGYCRVTDLFDLVRKPTQIK